MRDVVGYEGLYAITSCGRVYSYRAKKFLKPQEAKGNYLQVCLYKNHNRKWYYIHRLVAEAYIPNPLNLPCVNHIDERKTNNALLNLEWVTYEENNNFGTRNERIAKSLSKKIFCIETNEIFNSINEAAKTIDISPSNISRCLAGRRKTAGGFHFKYYDQKEED